MKKLTWLAIGLFVMTFMMLTVGCSSDKANPLASFEPEIVNTADAFQFQATGVENVTTILEYTWENGSTSATVNHSTMTNSGDAVVTIYDADSTQVYASGLAASLNEATQTGTAGSWRVRVVLNNFSGTVNFRVEQG